MKKVFRIILINGFIFLGLLLILELLFRIFGFGYGNLPFEMDPFLHHVHPKNYQFTPYDVKGEFGGHKVTYNQFRRRVSEIHDGKKYSKGEIWFFGDSFTEAKEVSWENSYVGIIDSKTDKKTSNYGVIGYSPLIYYLQLKRELSSENNPETVFIQLYSNDVSDDKAYSGKSVFNDFDRPILCDGGQTSIVRKALRKIYVLRVIRRAQMTIKYLLKEENNNHKKYKERHPEHNENWDSIDRFSKSIVQINQLLDSLEIKHFFFAIPSKNSCLTNNWHAANFPSKFNQMALKDSLPYIDLNPIFRKSENVSNLFFKTDIHCNEHGNKVIANELLKYINN